MDHLPSSSAEHLAPNKHNWEGRTTSSLQFVSVLKQLRLLRATQKKVKFPVKALLSSKSGTYLRCCRRQISTTLDGCVPAACSELLQRFFPPSQTFKYQDYSAALVINPPKAQQLEEKAAWGPCKVVTASVTDLLSRDEADQNFLTWVTAQIHQPPSLGPPCLARHPQCQWDMGEAKSTQTQCWLSLFYFKEKLPNIYVKKKKPNPTKQERNSKDL